MTSPLLHVVCPACATLNRFAQDRPAEAAKCGHCHKPLFTGKPTDVDADGFERHIARNDIPVVVDFWAPWCGPCRMMGPAFERAAKELEPRFRLLKINSDEAPTLMSRYGIRGIPTMLMFSRGKLVGQTSGAMETGRILSWIREHAPAEQTAL